MSFVGNQFQNGFDAAQRQGGVAKGFSGSHDVLTYEDIRFKGALGRKEAELFSQISPQETSYENHALVYVEESPLCYDTRVFEEKEEEEEYERQQRQQQSGGAKEEEEVKEAATQQATVVQRKNTMEMEHGDPRGTGTHSDDVEKVQKPAVKELRETAEVQGTDAPPGKSDEVEEEQSRLVVDEEDISGEDRDEADVGGVPEPTIEEAKEKGDVSDGRKRKSAPLSASVKEQVPEKKRTKSRKTSSVEKEKQKTAGPRVTRTSPRTAAVKLPNKKKFTHDELQLPSPEWKAYIVSMGKKEKNMVYHSPEGIICHSLEMVKGVESKRLESLKLKGALHGLMRSVGKLKRDPSAMDSLDAKHLSRDAVLLYRIWRARCHAEENE
ncbi:hypothetical protein PSENEW3_00006247 [Picochlorum sp. SENEW3]|nr:hypothetical protein PSENEW3_00006247 [Picochlorum sp. SENEW3]